MAIGAKVWVWDDEAEDDGDLVPGVVLVERSDTDEIAVHFRANSESKSDSAYLSRFEAGKLVASLEKAAEDERG